MKDESKFLAFRIVRESYASGFLVVCIICLLLFGLSGCGETIDLYGESRLDRPDPVANTEKDWDSPYRNKKPTEQEANQAATSNQSDINSEGIFLIVPPADINPKNLESDPDPKLITIDFQKGFEWLPTEVIVDGEVIFSERLRSKPNGFADSVSFQYTDVPARFTLVFPTLGMSERFTVDPSKGRFLGINFVNRELSLELQESPFFYTTE